MRLLQTFIVGVLGFVAWSLVSGANHAPPEVIHATNLQQLARQAETGQLPILIEFSSSYCSYCEQLEEDFLKPMLISGDYSDRVIIRKLDIDAADYLVDFDGGRISAEDFADRYDVSLTPTVVLLGPQGVELTEKLIGLTTPDFYGGYLDAAIDASLGHMRNHAQPSTADMQPATDSAAL